MDQRTIGEIVRKQESDYIYGTTQESKYVNFSMFNTIENIDAYMNSKHLSGENDSLGREKPFFNISVAAANVWYRATDIDRKNIKIRATKSEDWLDSLIATFYFRDWMRRENFGHYLNNWGRILSRYCSAVTKVVENSSGLHIGTVPWNRLIVDPLDFDNNPQIEVLYLTMAQLRDRVRTHGYDAEAVKSLCSALTTRKTLDKQTKDRKSDYVKLYEIHLIAAKNLVTGADSDAEIYAQQMHVVSYVLTKNGGRGRKEYEDYTVFKGLEDKSPYRIAHLMPEDNRTLGIGPVELLFQSQWMVNHSMKAVKDTLDLASKLIFKTADTSFVGRNILTDLETGDFLVHAPNQDFSAINMYKPEMNQFGDFAVQWKDVGREITGVSEAMLGAMPKSGTAWRTVETTLNENYSLFTEMTENKGLYLEDLIRKDILPHLKKKMTNSKEIAATLESLEIEKIDPRYIKDRSVREAGRKVIVRDLLKGTIPSQLEYDEARESSQNTIKDDLSTLGETRFFKPSEISDKTWAEQFKNLEWDVEVDITGENEDVQAALTSLNTALQLVVQPGFAQNKKAQAIVGRILEMTGAMSPVNFNAIPDAAPALPAPQPQMGAA